MSEERKSTTDLVLELILAECRYWHGRDEARRGNFASLYASARELVVRERASTPAPEAAGAKPRLPVRLWDDPDADFPPNYAKGWNDATDYYAELNGMPATARALPVEFLKSLEHYLECSANLTEKGYGSEGYEHARELRSLLNQS